MTILFHGLIHVLIVDYHRLLQKPPFLMYFYAKLQLLFFIIKGPEICRIASIYFNKTLYGYMAISPYD